MISFENVSKFVISELTIHIPKGVSVGIIGASGAGKTTFLKLACGLLAPAQGEVYTRKQNPVENRVLLGRKIGCLLERMPVLNAEHSVAENFRELQIVYRMSDAEFQKEYQALAERFEIQEYEQESVKSLSFGQRRRAELAAVLLHRPELLLLDEPTNALDENAKNILREILQERVREGMTVVMTSHDMYEVEQVCQRIIVLDKGRKIYYGEKAMLLRKFAPMDTMRIKWSGKLPDMEDLPLVKYAVEGNELSLTYNSNHVTSAEILEVLLKQSSIQAVTIQKQNLADVIFAIKSTGEKGE